MADENRACEVPLIERLRRLPADYRVCRETHWMEDGTCVGHEITPVGFLMHKAADELAALKSRVEELRIGAADAMAKKWEFAAEVEALQSDLERHVRIVAQEAVTRARLEKELSSLKDYVAEVLQPQMEQAERDLKLALDTVDKEMAEAILWREKFEQAERDALRLAEELFALINYRREHSLSREVWHEPDDSDDCGKFAIRILGDALETHPEHPTWYRFKDASKRAMTPQHVMDRALSQASGKEKA